MNSEDIKNSLEIPHKINTSNNHKFQEFSTLFLKYNKRLIRTAIDLPEIKATPIEVVVHKASQIGPGILVEDTSLEVEGVDIGINIKWLLDHLKNLKGKKAAWRVLLAFRQGEFVNVHEGIVKGAIAAKAGESEFGFDPFFIPEGSVKTLAQEKSDETNARTLTVDALFKGNPLAIHPIIKAWDGPWQ
jgi:XTP/dITP diphosphohydrolase